MRVPLLAAVVSLVLTAPMLAQQPVGAGDQWPVYGGDAGGSKYSALADITRANVSSLTVAWEWRPEDLPLEQYGTRPGTFQTTPLMIDGVLYATTQYNRVAALDPETGRPRWTFDPKTYVDGQPPNGTGYVHRGVAAWRDSRQGGKLHIFLATRWRLFCLDAATGQPVPSFGQGGWIDLTTGLLWPIERRHYTNTSPPVVYKNLVIMGNGVGDRLMYRNDPPGDIRAFDARTGRQVWSFHTVPQRAEFGHDTWQEGSTRFTGHTNAWAPMSLDAARGLLYVPVGTPSNDYYGGFRKGEGLFGETLLCLDATTGRRKWHYQLVHHGLWDYDPPSPPNLVTIRPNGVPVDAVVQLTKQGFAFVFDRVTGKPVWPIEERPVGRSDVPGEEAWPTQPFPTKPAVFAEQGVSLDDAFDLTPALKAAAQAEMKKYRLGPLYTPPSLEGTLMRPSTIGGANWGGGAFDPESGWLFVKTTNQMNNVRIQKPNFPAGSERAKEVDAAIIGSPAGPTEFTPPGRTPEGREFPPLPMLKPPYGHVSAINLQTGEIAWRVPFGDNPDLRAHPALAGVPLPEKLGAPGAAGVLATRGGVLFVSGNDGAFHALDTATGRDLWTHRLLPRRATGTPMTYRGASGRQYVVVATSNGPDASLMAFALPK